VNHKFLLRIVFILGSIFLSGYTRASGAGPGLRVNSDFPGGSAQVLDIDPSNNFIRIMPAGDPVYGWPNWWFFRLEGADTNKPVVLEVVASQGTVQTDTPGQFRKLPAN
jgi:hypothetical protein